MDLILKQGSRQDQKLGFPPVDRFLTELKLVSESRRDQATRTHFDPPRPWTLRRFFPLINELAHIQLIIGLSQFRKKDGALDHIVTISNIYACGD